MITSKQLLSYFLNAVKEGWGYVWSLNGELYTKELAQKYHDKRRSTSKHRDPATYWLKDCAKWIGKMAADCSGGIVGAIRSVNKSYSDRTANTFYSQCTKKGKISTLPEIPGICVWKSGHIELYEGNGNSIGFKGTSDGACRTPLNPAKGINPQKFTNWGMLRDVDYGVAAVNDDIPTPTAPNSFAVSRVLKLSNPMLRGDDVKELQARLYDAGIKMVVINGEAKALKVDGTFGEITEAAVKMYQASVGLTVDGKAGKNTIRTLGGVWNG